MRSRGASYALAGWVTLRALGLIYLIAFLSFWVQVDGLIGPDGILPATELLGAVEGQLGLLRYWFFPTVFWLGSGSIALHLGCAVGVVAALLLVLDWWPTTQLVVLWSLYLSLSTVARDFLSFQWDTLLLEAGLLGMVLAGARAKR